MGEADDTDPGTPKAKREERGTKTELARLRELVATQRAGLDLLEKRFSALAGRVTALENARRP